MNWVAKTERNRPISWLSLSRHERHRMQMHCRHISCRRSFFPGKKAWRINVNVSYFAAGRIRTYAPKRETDFESLALTTQPRLLAMVRFQSLLAFPADVLLWRTVVRESSGQKNYLFCRIPNFPLNASWRRIEYSFEPDLNRRPMDSRQHATTVHRSTNWAIEGHGSDGSKFTVYSVYLNQFQRTLTAVSVKGETS